MRDGLLIVLVLLLIPGNNVIGALQGLLGAHLPSFGVLPAGRPEVLSTPATSARPRGPDILLVVEILHVQAILLQNRGP